MSRQTLPKGPTAGQAIAQLKMPIKSKPAKPAPKRAGNHAACASSSNPQPIPELRTEHVQEFKVVWSRKKKFHTVPVERAWE